MTGDRTRTAVRETCSICQFPVGADEERTQCPHCGLPFHAECWEQNHGCSAYGCPQVGVLKPAGNDGRAAGTRPEPAGGPLPRVHGAAPSEPFPWEFLLLGASVLGGLVGLLAFGAPCAVLLLVVLGHHFRRKSKRSWMVFLLTVLVCLAGIIGGGLASWSLWIGPGAAY